MADYGVSRLLCDEPEPSRLDGLPALALFEGRATLQEVDEPVDSTDPAPGWLSAVCAEWRLRLEPIAVD